MLSKTLSSDAHKFFAFCLFSSGAKFFWFVLRAAVSIPAVAAASVSHSAAVGGSVVGVVGLL